MPLVGCIPELKDLACPTMADYSKLLKSEMISGRWRTCAALLAHRSSASLTVWFPAGHDANTRYFTSTRLALAPVDDKNLFKAIPNQLVITVRWPRSLLSVARWHPGR